MHPSGLERMIDLKKIFMTAAIVAIFFAWSGLVEAAGFTQEQVDKIMASVNQNPASSPENKLTLNLTPAQLQTSFNAEVKPILDKTQFDNDEERAMMEKIFLIQDFQVFESDAGKFYMNVFGNNAAIFGVSGNDNDGLKLATCAYANPETNAEKTLSSVILFSFVKVVAPAENPQTLLESLAAEQTGTLIRNGIKFSAARDGDLILLSAVKAAD